MPAIANRQSIGCFLAFPASNKPYQIFYSQARKLFSCLHIWPFGRGSEDIFLLDAFMDQFASSDRPYSSVMLELISFPAS
jgi:hypothetical protein